MHAGIHVNAPHYNGQLQARGAVLSRPAGFVMTSIWKLQLTPSQSSPLLPTAPSHPPERYPPAPWVVVNPFRAAPMA